MPWLWPGRLTPVNPASAILHCRVQAKPVPLLAFSPTPWMQGEGGTGLFHELAAVDLPPNIASSIRNKPAEAMKQWFSGH